MENLNHIDIGNKNIFSNPNIKYNSTLFFSSGHCYGYNDIFEVYIHQKLNEAFFAANNNQNYIIYIFDLSYKKLIKKLTNHDINILSIKYYIKNEVIIFFNIHFCFMY